MTTTDALIAALRRERAGYVARGLDDRVAQVDQALRAAGYRPDGEDARKAPPVARTAERPRETTARPEVKQG